MRLDIDASNIRAGGGVTHLVELLTSANPPAYGFEQVTIWKSDTRSVVCQITLGSNARITH